MEGGERLERDQEESGNISQHLRDNFMDYLSVELRETGIKY